MCFMQIRLLNRPNLYKLGYSIILNNINCYKCHHFNKYLTPKNHLSISHKIYTRQ